MKRSVKSDNSFVPPVGIRCGDPGHFSISNEWSCQLGRFSQSTDTVQVATDNIVVQGQTKSCDFCKVYKQGAGCHRNISDLNTTLKRWWRTEVGWGGGN